MRRIGTILAAVLVTTGTALAQVPPLPPAPPVLPVSPVPPALALAQDAGTPREVVQFGSDYTLEAGESVEDLVVIGGGATIRGEVEGDAVVIGGPAELAGTGSVDGDFVVIGGNATIGQGAAVDGDLVVIGGAVESPQGFAPGGEFVAMAGPIGDLMPFVTRGLFTGRVLVPDLAWLWGAVAVLLAVFLGLNLVFDRPVRACIDALASKPLTTFLIGLIVLVLAGPVTVLLAVSVVGLVVVPFLWAALAAATFFGGVAVSRWLGEAVLRSEAGESRGREALALLVGFLLICLALMVPVLGAVTFASLGVLALGGASAAVAKGLRQENPAPAPASAPAGGASPPVPGPEDREGAPPEPVLGDPVQPPLPAELAQLPRASFLARTGAFLLDLLLVGLIFGLLGLDEGQWFFALLIAYHIALWGWKGTTVGGVVANLRVVRTDGFPLAFTDALVRGLSSIFSAVVLGIGFFWILKEPEREAWHDKIAGTCVVSVPKGWPRP